MPELHYDDQSWRALARKLPAIAPTYFVSGNHEWWKGNFEEVEAELMKFGIQVLRNKTISLVANGRAINITGVDDPEAWKGDNKIYLNTINRLSQELPKQALSLLLVHRPEHFNDYDKTAFQMIFAGHAHGGKFRLPFIGGLLSPNQGALPKFTSGLYEGKNVKMIVSRGLGNSVFPLRLFNYPEIIVVDF